MGAGIVSASECVGESVGRIAPGVNVDGSIELEKHAEGIGTEDPKRGRDVTWIITAGERIRSRAAEAVVGRLADLAGRQQADDAVHEAMGATAARRRASRR
jgi:hypothetical protein